MSISTSSDSAPPHSGIAAIASIAHSWRAHPVKLKRFLSRYEYNAADVEDIIQDTLIEGMRCVDRFEGKSSMESWLFGIAINVARHHVAAATQRSRRMTSLDEITEDMPDLLDRFCSTAVSDDPSRQTQGMQFAHKLVESVSAMPVALQQTFELLCIQEYSYAEAAEALAIPIGTVRSRLHRVRELLKPVIM